MFENDQQTKCLGHSSPIMRFWASFSYQMLLLQVKMQLKFLVGCGERGVNGPPFSCWLQNKTVTVINKLIKCKSYSSYRIIAGFETA